jgi:hypothetical protein
MEGRTLGKSSHLFGFAGTFYSGLGNKYRAPNHPLLEIEARLRYPLEKSF